MKRLFYNMCNILLGGYFTVFTRQKMRRRSIINVRSAGRIHLRKEAFSWNVLYQEFMNY